MTENTQSSSLFQVGLSPTECMKRAAFFMKLALLTDNEEFKREWLEYAIRFTTLAEDGQ